MRISWAVSCLAVVMSAAPPCWAVPEGLPASTPQSAADEGQASAAYNEGLALAEKGDLTAANAAEEAKQAYAAALAKFREATQLDPEMPGAWNMLGYTERKLGN